MTNVLDLVADELDLAATPLKVTEITKRILARKVWQTKGKTPAATVESRLAVDVKVHASTTRFVRTAPATYGLRSWPGIQAAPQKPRAKAGLLTYLDAAEAVLSAAKDHQPLHAKVITDRAIAAGLLSPSGLTPEQTMYVQLMTDVKRRRERANDPRFWQLPKGRFGLAAWQDKDLVALVSRHNGEVKKQLLDRLHKMKWIEFEKLIGGLLVELGFENVDVTSPGGDKGIDVRGTLVTGSVVRTKMAVQVKRWTANVQAPTVQNVRGSLDVHEQGLIITTSDFSAGARDEAARPNKIPVGLMNGDELVGLLVEHGIGVTRQDLDLLELAPIDKTV